MVADGVLAVKRAAAYAGAPVAVIEHELSVLRANGAVGS